MACLYLLLRDVCYRKCYNVMCVFYCCRHRCSRYSFMVRTTAELRAQCNTYVRALQGSSELGSYLASLMLHNCSLVSFLLHNWGLVSSLLHSWALVSFLLHNYSLANFLLQNHMLENLFVFFPLKCHPVCVNYQLVTN